VGPNDPNAIVMSDLTTTVHNTVLHCTVVVRSDQTIALGSLGPIYTPPAPTKRPRFDRHRAVQDGAITTSLRSLGPICRQHGDRYGPYTKHCWHCVVP